MPNLSQGQLIPTTNFFQAPENEGLLRFLLPFTNNNTSFIWDGTEGSNLGTLHAQSITIDNSFGPLDLILSWGQQAQFKISVQAGHIASFPVPAITQPWFQIATVLKPAFTFFSWSAVIYLHNYPVPPQDFETYRSILSVGMVVNQVGAGALTVLPGVPNDRYKLKSAKLLLLNTSISIAGTYEFTLIADTNVLGQMDLNNSAGVGWGSTVVDIFKESVILGNLNDSLQVNVTGPGVFTNNVPTILIEYALLPG